MTAADRRFASNLFLVFGPLFVAGGFLAAFTDPGALFVYLGVAMFVTGLLLRTRLPTAAAVAAGVMLFCLELAWLIRERTA
jgi:hypothetical protein